MASPSSETSSGVRLYWTWVRTFSRGARPRGTSGTGSRVKAAELAEVLMLHTLLHTPTEKGVGVDRSLRRDPIVASDLWKWALNWSFSYSDRRGSHWCQPTVSQGPPWGPGCVVRCASRESGHSGPPHRRTNG